MSCPQKSCSKSSPKQSKGGMECANPTSQDSFATTSATVDTSWQQWKPSTSTPLARSTWNTSQRTSSVLKSTQSAEETPFKSLLTEMRAVDFRVAISEFKGGKIVAETLYDFMSCIPKLKSVVISAQAYTDVLMLEPLPSKMKGVIRGMEGELGKVFMKIKFCVKDMDWNAMLALMSGHHVLLHRGNVLTDADQVGIE